MDSFFLALLGKCFSDRLTFIKGIENTPENMRIGIIQPIGLFIVMNQLNTFRNNRIYLVLGLLEIKAGKYEFSECTNVSSTQNRCQNPLLQRRLHHVYRQMQESQWSQQPAEEQSA